MSESAPPTATVTAKPKGKLAIYWAASCGGCEISILGSTPRSWTSAAAFDSSCAPASPTAKSATSRRWRTAKSTSACSTAASAPANRSTWPACCGRSPRCLIAFGSCATEGCIPGLGNLHNPQRDLRQLVPGSGSTENPNDVRPQTVTKVPEGDLHLPVFYDTLKTLDQTVDVDYYLPGCPPESPTDLGSDRGDRVRQTAAQGHGDRSEHDRLRLLPADSAQQEDQGVQADLGGHPGRRDLPAGTGTALRRTWRPAPGAARCARKSTRPASAATGRTRTSRTTARG
jgi:Ni,Fe-hydrogenase III small subunit